MTNTQPASQATTALDRVFELTERLAGLMAYALGEWGLTPARAEVIVVLSRQGPLVQRELSEMLRCSARHVTTLVDALESNGYVERRAHPKDRRASLVVMTAKGKDVAARMQAERQQAAQILLGDVPAIDLGGFIAVADHLLARLAEFDAKHTRS